MTVMIWFNQLKLRVHAGNTTYRADNHPNSTKPRHRNSMDVNQYKNEEESQIHETNIYKGIYWSSALERSATNASLGFKPGLRALNLTLTSLRNLSNKHYIRDMFILGLL